MYLMSVPKDTVFEENTQRFEWVFYFERLHRKRFLAR